MRARGVHQFGVSLVSIIEIWGMAQCMWGGGAR